MFEPINQKYFSGQLRVTVECASLTAVQDRGLITRFDDENDVVQIDRVTNPDSASVERTLQHESRHVFVGPELKHSEK